MAKGNFPLGVLAGTLMSMILVTLLLFVRVGPLLAVLLSGILAGYIAGSLSRGALAGLISGALGPLFSLGVVFVVFRALLQRLAELLSVNIPPGLKGVAALALMLIAALLVLIGGLVGLVGGLIGGAIRKSMTGGSKDQGVGTPLPPP